MDPLAFCIHGHFYQPPRENPITGQIPIEPGAAPFLNWNEKIDAQCYRPNAQLGNFEQISFNIGPTLMDWLGTHDPSTLASIIQQDQHNVQQYGVGNAMAQSYNHTILPLASRRDKITQVLWGMADFEFRFGHRPQGLWLPETAVDDETLEVLAECGIEFTILAPWQTGVQNLDSKQPYEVRLKDGKKITVFFYNQDLSTRISFDPGATENADRFLLEGLLPRFEMRKGRPAGPQLILVASDGELYGHHQPFRDKFLAYLMDGALSSYPIERTFPALWLRQHPPTQEITILPNTSWSCHHGVTRWMDSCGCTTENHWKAPLRRALDLIGDAVDQQFVQVIERYGVDPWKLRDEFIWVVLNERTFPEFIASQIHQKLEDDEVRQLGYLLWAQYERQRVFTSCGWFFDDFDRIEPRNNVAYASQAVWLTQKAVGVDLTPLSLKALSVVVSERTGLKADQIFRRQIAQAKQGLEKYRKL